MKKNYLLPDTAIIYVSVQMPMLISSPVNVDINKSGTVDADQAASRQAVNIWDESEYDE